MPDSHVESAAKSLTDCQTRYGQIEKELSAILFACKRFKYYVLGLKEICAEVNHLPLLGLMEKDITTLSLPVAAIRIKLPKFSIAIEYKLGKDLVLAGPLSRSCSQEIIGTEDHDSDPLL